MALNGLKFGTLLLSRLFSNTLLAIFDILFCSRVIHRFVPKNGPKLTCGRVFQHNFISKANLKNPEQGFFVHRFYLLRQQKESLARPVFNLNAIEFGAFSPLFTFLAQSDTTFPNKYNNAKTFYFRQAFRHLLRSTRLKIALQVSKLGFSPIVRNWTFDENHYLVSSLKYLLKRIFW